MVLDVTLNIYNLSSANKYFSWMGLGAYHTGVTVGQREYTFSPDGIVTCVPSHPEEVIAEGVTFKESVVLGQVEHMSQVNAVVAELRRTFPQGSYHLVSQNCNHFTNAFCEKLLNKSIPGYVNRSARLGHVFVGRKSEAKQSADKDAKLAKKAALAKQKHDNTRPSMSEKQKAALAKLKRSQAGGADTNQQTNAEKGGGETNQGSEAATSES